MIHRHRAEAVLLFLRLPSKVIKRDLDDTMNDLLRLPLLLPPS